MKYKEYTGWFEFAEPGIRCTERGMFSPRLYLLDVWEGREGWEGWEGEGGEGRGYKVATEKPAAWYKFLSNSSSKR